MKKKVDPVVDEAIETLNMKDGPSRRRLLEGAGLFSATAAASALIAACSSSSSSSASSTSTASATAAAAGNFPSTPKWKFTFVNHVTDNSFFTPTQYGFQDCAALLGLPTPPGPVPCPPSRRCPPCCRPSRPPSRPVLRASRPPWSRPPRLSPPSTARWPRASRSSRTTRTVPPPTPPTARPTSARTCSRRARRWASDSPR